MERLHALNKTVLSVKNNPSAFLNGITSNTLDRPKNAFLNLHGKIIAVFDQIRKSEDEFWMVVESAFVDALLEHIDRFVRLSKVEVKALDKKVYFDIDEKHLVIADSARESAVSEEEFTLFRLRHNLPVQGIDFKNEFVLNVSETEYVSFTKGCFLGQEPVAKVHNRSRPTWQLVVKYTDECAPEETGKMTSKTIDPDTRKEMGFVFTKNAL